MASLPPLTLDTVSRALSAQPSPAADAKESTLVINFVGVHAWQLDAIREQVQDFAQICMMRTLQSEQTPLMINKPIAPPPRDEARLILEQHCAQQHQHQHQLLLHLLQQQHQELQQHGQHQLLQQQLLSVQQQPPKFDPSAMHLKRAPTTLVEESANKRQKDMPQEADQLRVLQQLLLSVQQQRPHLELSALQQLSSAPAPLEEESTDVSNKRQKAAPRWSPTQPQLQALDAFFAESQGTPSKPRIKEISDQLQEFGPITESSVYNWFRNRKARTKRHKGAEDAEQPSTSDGTTGTQD